MKIQINCLALLMCAPLIAQAQVNKCKQPDGSLTFQDFPCPSGTVSSKITLPPMAARSDGISSESSGEVGKMKQRRNIQSTQETKSQLDQVRDYQNRRVNEEIREHNEKAEAFNRNLRCNQARQQLGVVKEALPVYHYDNKGERQYLEDGNRPAAISAAEQRVAKECN